MWSWCRLVVVAWAMCVGAGVPLEDDLSPLTRVARQQPTFGITHLDIRDAILKLEKSIKVVTSKLNRHEAREAQVADFSTKILNALAGDVSQSAAGIQAVARQLARMEERFLSLESLVQTSEERQRTTLEHMRAGLDRLLSQPPQLEGFPGQGPPDDSPQDSAVTSNLKKILRKVNNVETLVQEELLRVTNEVRMVGESVTQHGGQLQERHDRLAARLQECDALTNTALHQLSADLTAALQESGGGGACSEGQPMSPDAPSLDDLDRYFRQQEALLTSLSQHTNQTLSQQTAALERLLVESQAGHKVFNTSWAELTRNLVAYNTATHEGLDRYSSEVMAAVRDNAATLAASLSSLGNELKEGNSNIMDGIDDGSSQMENLQHSVLDNYAELSTEINSLRQVEQVMINTADSVLDTKRSIEFGIQQIILELGEIVKNSGSTINNTLSDQISNISFAILKNQTSALTNMTAKMEKEISQVWRQIGIMYQQMSQSVELLDQLRDTTKEHMNVSLSRVGNMDGTVDQISTKVEDVESNLNYLLGRLSLVVSEFNIMKSGVGEELLRLKQNMAEENTHIAGEDQISANKYAISRKRHAIPPQQPYPGYNPQPIGIF